MFTGKEIYDKRISLGWSAKDLAIRLKTKGHIVSIENVYKWERGIKPKNHETTKKIEEWLKSENEKPKQLNGKKMLGRKSKPPRKLEINHIDYRGKFLEVEKKYIELLEKYNSFLENLKR